MIDGEITVPLLRDLKTGGNVNPAFRVQLPRRTAIMYPTGVNETAGSTETLNVSGRAPGQYLSSNPVNNGRYNDGQIQIMGLEEARHPDPAVQGRTPGKDNRGEKIDQQVKWFSKYNATHSFWGMLAFF